MDFLEESLKVQYSNTASREFHQAFLEAFLEKSLDKSFWNLHKCLKDISLKNLAGIALQGSPRIPLAIISGVGTRAATGTLTVVPIDAAIGKKKFICNI